MIKDCSCCGKEHPYLSLGDICPNAVIRLGEENESLKAEVERLKGYDYWDEHPETDKLTTKWSNEKKRAEKAEAELDGMKQVNLDLLDDVARLREAVIELGNFVRGGPTSKTEREVYDILERSDKALNPKGGDEK